jgi:hypothetical protein
LQLVLSLIQVFSYQKISFCIDNLIEQIVHTKLFLVYL